MKRLFPAVALAVTVLALVLPTRAQTFTRTVVDGHVLRLLITGSGGPAVVFENGLGGPLENWGKVQPAISRFVQTVSYDRSGVGLSTGPSSRDGERIAADLRAALTTARVAPPYVLVGASIGGRYAGDFAARYPDAVAGVVLVDPTFDQPADRQRRLTLPVVLIDSVSPPEVPFATAAIRVQRAANRRDIDAESVAYRAWLDTIPGSRLVVTHRSGHNIPQEEPALIVDAVQRFVTQLRTGPSAR